MAVGAHEYVGHRAVPEEADAAPAGCHGVELVRRAGGDEHPLLSDEFRGRDVQRVDVDAFHGAMSAIVGQHILQDAPGAEVFLLDGRIDAHDERQLEGLFPGGLHHEGGSTARSHVVAQPGDGEGHILEPLHAVVVCGIGKVEGQHAHADEVAAVDAFKALGDDGTHAQQVRALGCPVAAGAHAVVFSADDDGGNSGGAVGHTRIVDEGGLAAGGADVRIRSADLSIAEVERVTAFHSFREQVLDAHVGKGAARHHEVVAAAGAEGIEITALHTVGGQEDAGRTGGFDGSGGGDVIRGHAVTKDTQRPGIGDVGDIAPGAGETVEEGRAVDVGGFRVPAEGGTGGGFHAVPFRHVAGVAGGIVLRGGGAGLSGGNFLARGPDVAQVDRGAVRSRAQRLAVHIDVHASGEGKGDDQRGRHEEVRLDVGVNAGLEVAVAGEDGAGDEVVFHNCFLNGGVDGAGIADAGGAAVTHDGEADAVQRFREPVVGEVAGGNAGARGDAGLDVGRDFQSERGGLLSQQPGGEHEPVVAGVGATGDSRHQDGAVLQLHIMRGVGIGVAGISRHGDGNGCGVLLRSVGVAADGGKALLERGQRDAILRTLGACHGRLDGGEVELQLDGVVNIAFLRHAEEPLSTQVGLAGGGVLLAAAGGAQVGGRGFIEGEEAHGSTVFRSHVGHGGAVGQGKAGCTFTEEFHELAHHALLAQHLGDVQGQIGSGDTLSQFAAQVDTHDLRHQEGDRLAEHAGLCLNAAYAPGHDAQTVNHGGVGVCAHQSVRVVHAVFLHDASCQIFQIHLVDDTGAGRNHGEGLEGLLAPFQELVALCVALKLAREILLVGFREPGPVHLHGVVNHQIHGHQRFHFVGVGTQILNGGTHGCQIHQQGNARQILQDDASHGEGYLIIAGVLGIPACQISDIFFCDLEPVTVAQQAFQYNAERNRHAADAGIPRLCQCRQRVIVPLSSVPGGKCAFCVHSVP